MTIEEAIKIFSNYALVGTLEETGVEVAFHATPAQFGAAIEAARSALCMQLAEQLLEKIMQHVIPALREYYPKDLGAVEIARRAAIEELISPAVLSPSAENVMERCFGMDKMFYRLYKCVDGTWFTWGTYSDPLRLARAANELGLMGLEIKVEAEGTQCLSYAL